jgi:pyrroline-5-carboxylate reductase
MEFSVIRIGFLGIGNMGTALIDGLIASGKAVPNTISAYDVDAAKLERLAKRTGIEPSDSMEDLAGTSSALFLCVKPQVLSKILPHISSCITNQSLVISIAAGISSDFIFSWTGRTLRLIRAMPNAAALIGESATALCKAGNASDEDLKLVEDLFESIGKVVLIEEKMMNVVTGLSGSGPAYIYVLLEAMTDAGVRMGLDRNTARLLSIQTVFGAAKSAMTGEAFSDLKDRVTSPGGTTAAGLHVLEKEGFRGIMYDVIQAATLRAEELAGK